MGSPKHNVKYIAQSLADGLSPVEISEKKNVSKRTIERQIDVMKDVYDAKNTCHLVAIFFRDGLIK